MKPVSLTELRTGTRKTENLTDGQHQLLSISQVFTVEGPDSN